MVIRLFVLIAILTSVRLEDAGAEIVFYRDHKIYSSDHSATFLETTLDKLPPVMKLFVDHYEVRVDFDIDSPLVTPICSDPSATLAAVIDSGNGILKAKETHIGATQAQPILGSSEGCKRGRRKCQINLNRHFIDIIERKGSVETYKCQHRNPYRLAIATLIHELAHLFDQEGRERLFTSSDRKVAKFCLGQTLGASQIDLCKALNHKFAVSDRIDFLNLIGWERRLLSMDRFKNGPLGHKGNQEYFRSPDPYEYKDPQEHFAVNMEYFLNDPEYRCRRPLYYEYYSNIFDLRPVSNCQFNTKVFLTGRSEEVDLTREDLTRIDYLFVEESDSPVSQFGHSAFLLSFQRGHYVDQYVLSYVANTDFPNTWDGLTGAYRMKMEIHRFDDYIAANRWIEKRAITKFRLNLNSTQKSRFLFKALQTYWESYSSYYFIANNCATAAFLHLQSAFLGNPIWQIVQKKIVTPRGLLAFLIEKRLVSRTEESVVKPNRDFLGKLWLGLSALEGHLSLMDSYPNLAAYLETHSLGSKLNHIYALIEKNPHQKKKIILSFIELENQILIDTQTELTKRVLDLVSERVSRSLQRLDQVPDSDSVKQLLRLSDYTFPALFTQSGYGIPMRSEIVSKEFVKKANQKGRELLSELYQSALDSYRIPFQTKRAIDNSTFIIEELRKNKHNM